MSDLNTLYNEAEALKDAGKFEESIDKLNSILATDESHVLAHFGAGCGVRQSQQARRCYQTRPTCLRARTNGTVQLHGLERHVATGLAGHAKAGVHPACRGRDGARPHLAGPIGRKPYNPKTNPLGKWVIAKAEERQPTTRTTDETRDTIACHFRDLHGTVLGHVRSDDRKRPIEMWSPFKPYVFIGIAYLVLAIIGGLIAMQIRGDTFSYSGAHFAPAKWGFLAGCLGALGALFLTSAMMTSKGNALLVMPIVFGGAVSVTAIFSTWKLREHVTISPMLWVGMALVIIGVIIVARNTPHGHANRHPTATRQQRHLTANRPSETSGCTEPDNT